MTPQDALDRLEEIVAQDGDDPESEHYEADRVLCALLDELGFDDITEQWKRVAKWYS